MNQRPSVSTTVVAVLMSAATALLPATAGAAVKPATQQKLYPSIQKVAPKKAGIGDRMTISGKGFRKGKNRNTVVFKRDGKRAIFVRATGSSTKKISVVVPAKLLPMLGQKAGKPVATRFRVRVLAARFGKRYTSAKASPLIGPTPLNVKVAKDDCDGDGLTNSVDKDDDNDLLSDVDEAAMKTDRCLRDSDADGLSDGWEHHSALDRNGKAKPAPTRKPYPNALDAGDANIDHDGDGLSNLEEYVAWVTGSSKLRDADSDPYTSRLSYSGGNPNSDGRPRVTDGWLDRDGNGFLSDLERDADGDGVPNLDEERAGSGSEAAGWSVAPVGPFKRPFGLFTAGYLAEAAAIPIDLGLQCAGINDSPVYCADRLKLEVSTVDTLSWVDADTDGDGIGDAQDDVDHDDVTNAAEYTAVKAAFDAGGRSDEHLNACVPDRNSRFCLLGGGGQADTDLDGVINSIDTDDDNDLLTDVQELSIRTDPWRADTDGDDLVDGFEYYSALDLNSVALPYPSKKPYPNALDGKDANIDHDGDGLTALQEQRAWRYTGSPVPLSYSDGAQWTGGKAPASDYPPGSDLDGNGTISDDEKDVDGDGAINWAEANGSLSGPGWWDEWIKRLSNRGVGCDPENYTETAYPAPKYAGLDFVDPDTDGDGLLDGADDIDHDGLTNVQEIARPADWCRTYVSTGGIGGDPGHNWTGSALVNEFGAVANPYSRVQPFNPCKPVYSDACHLRPPLGYYKEIPATDTDPGYTEDWASPIHP